MLKLLAIGAGGFVGAILRYLISGLVQNLSGSIRFPFGTLAVNVIGCLFIGLLVYLVETRSMFGAAARMFVFIGLLGSFTTFSTFGNETPMPECTVPCCRGGVSTASISCRSFGTMMQVTVRSTSAIRIARSTR